MFLTDDRMYGIARQSGPAGAAATATASAHNTVVTRRPTRGTLSWTFDFLHERRSQRCASGRPFGVRSQPYDDQPLRAKHPSREPSPEPSSSAGSSLPRSRPAVTSTLVSSGRARQRAKRVWTSSDNDEDDLAWLADDDPSCANPVTAGPAAGGGPIHNPLSNAGTLPGAALSPATARALAKGFRAGDLALASTAPLRAWCGQLPRRVPAAPEHKLGVFSGSPAPLGLDSTPQAQPQPHTQPQTHNTSRPLLGQPSLPHQWLQPPPVRSPTAGGRYGVGVDLAVAGHIADGTSCHRSDIPRESALGGGNSSSSSTRDSDAFGSAGEADRGNVDVVLLGPPGRPRDLSVLVAVVERLTRRPAGQGCIGCVVVLPSRERVEALQETAFTLLAERGGGPEALHVMAVHGGTRFREDVSGLRSQTPDLLLATPGRLTEFLTTDQVRLSHLFESLRVLVLDGGEVLSSAAFRPQMERLLRLLPNTKRYTPPRTAPLRQRTSSAPAAAAAATAGAGSSSPSTSSTAGACPPAVTLLAAAGPAAAYYDTTAFKAPSGNTAGGHADQHARRSLQHASSRSSITAPLPRHPYDSLLLTGSSTVQRPMTSHAAGRELQQPPMVGPAMSGSPHDGGAITPPPELRSLTELALRRSSLTVQLGSASSNPGSQAHTGDGQWHDTDQNRDGDGSSQSLAAAVMEVLGNGVPIGGPHLPSAAQVEGPIHEEGREGRAVSPSIAAGAPAGSSSPGWTARAGSAVDPQSPPQPVAAPLVPLHVLSVPYEDHLPYLYVVVRQHMLSEGRHKIVVQFPSAHLANLYARLFQALGFPAASSHSRVGQLARQEAMRDFAAAHRGLLFCTDLAGVDAGCGLTMVLWVGLPFRPGQLIQQMGALQQAVSAGAASSCVTTAAAGAKTPISSDAALGGDQDRRGVAVAHAATAVVGAAAAPPPPVARAGLPGATGPLPLPRCLLMLHDVDAPRPVAMAVAEALAAAGLGRVLPVQPGVWSGTLDAVAHRIGQALPKVPPAMKLRGLEGLLGHLWSSRTSAAASGYPSGGGAGRTAAAAAAAGVVGAAGRACSWQAIGGGLGPQPEQRLGIWARRFATAMGMPQPPLLSRHAAARMGLRSIPGVILVDFHAGRPPPPSLVPPDLAGLPLDDPRVALAAQRRLHLLRLKEERQRRHQRLLQAHQLQKRLRQQQRREQQRLREQLLLERRAQRKERPKLHAPEVIGRFRWLRSRRRAERASGQRQAEAQSQAQEESQGQP